MRKVCEGELKVDVLVLESVLNVVKNAECGESMKKCAKSGESIRKCAKRDRMKKPYIS